MREKGFTLVELLVVIAIIALLIGILAPSLGRVKSLAREVLDTTNMRAGGMAMIAYAAANKSVFPYAASDVPHAPYQAEVCFNPDPIRAWIDETGLWSDARRYGLLYKLKILESPEMAYCPLNTILTNRLDTYDKPWGGMPLRPEQHASSGFIRGGYKMCPNVGLNPKTGKVDYGYFDAVGFHAIGINSERFPSDRPLSTDIISFDWRETPEDTSIVHFDGTTGRWNMVFSDGHIAGKVSKTATKNLRNWDYNYNAIGDWGNITDAKQFNYLAYYPILKEE
ncbi:MAG: prepilin-type N-terminal cleavage/methylation domain-containing protein [Phycisphaerae bacterium]|jgi:prepilin-type N-terminal cleavage/methylation domain-containing protein